MRFVPYEQLRSLPNIIVDGAACPSTLLTLSHWPKSGTPLELKRDTSAQIAFAYLDSASFHVEADAVSNNHFDEDGLVGIFALLNPSLAQSHRSLLEGAASAGDFGVYRKRDAARIAFTISAFADADTSPLPREIFERPYTQTAAELYHRLLELLPRLLTNTDDFKTLWESEDQKLSASEALMESGEITLTERPEIDLAIVQLPEDLAAGRVHRLTQSRTAECHPFAIHSRTKCSRVLILQGQHVEFQYRYESWVQLASRRPPARVDLSALASELNQQECSGGRWVFEGVDRITPRLYLEGRPATSLSHETIWNRLEQHLATGTPAWDPYD